MALHPLLKSCDWSHNPIINQVNHVAIINMSVLATVRSELELTASDERVHVNALVQSSYQANLARTDLSEPREIEFLDLADADEEQRSFIHTTLFTRDPNLKYPELPWIATSDLVCTSAEWRPAPYENLLQRLIMREHAHNADGIAPLNSNRYSLLQEKGRAEVSTPGEPADGPAIAAPLDGDDCNSTTQNTASPTAQEVVSQEAHSVTGAGAHTTSSVYPDASVMTVPPQIPTTVQTQPSVMTTVYHIPGVPLSNVYVGNVTANVNVHGFVNNPYAPYISPQQVYAGEVSHESAPAAVRNGGRETRPRRPKPNNKRMDGQFADRSAGRHSQEVISAQPPPLVDSPPTVNSNLTQPNFPMYPISPMHHHGYPATFYNTPTPSHPPHIPHHPSAQHAAGTPIYLPGHPAAMYAHPTIYSTYPHQPMPFATAMQSGPVPTTENSVLGNYQVEGNGTEERIPVPTQTIVSNKEVELGEPIVHQKQPSPQPLTFTSEPVELCQVTSEDIANTQQTSYQQQQSEEDDFNQTNLVGTVVVNNSNIVTEPLPFADTKQNGVGETKTRHIASSGHQKFSKDVLPPSFVPDSASSTEVLVDSNVSVSVAPRASTDASVSVNTVISDLDSKREKASVNTISFPPLAQQEKSQVDIKPSVSPVEIPASVPSKLAYGPSADSVPPFANNPQTIDNSVSIHHQTGGQNITYEMSNTQATTQKSWASLFWTNSGPNPTGEHSGSKLVACVKPLQSASPISSDPSHRVSESSAVQSMSSTGPSPVTSAIVGGKMFSHMQPPTSAEDPYLCRLGEFLSKYQLEHKALSLQPRGLTNRSNWCYINSTLQALLACPPFYNLMKALQAPLSARRTVKSTTPIIDSMVQFVGEFSPLSSATRPRDRKEKAVRKDDGSIEDQCGAPFEPNYIYKMLNSIRSESDTFKVEGRQEDAEEFLGCLLNALNDEMLELIKLVEEPATKTTLSNGDIATNGDTSVQKFGRTPISDIFRGQLRSRVHRAGDQSTDNVQPFFTLQLDIEVRFVEGCECKKAQSVKDALEILAVRDQLEGVTCSRTNQEVEAWKQVTLEELPLVLLLHLKWFDYKLDGASKIVKNVEFPIDLKVDQNVYHVGYGGWVRYDDSVVKSVQETNVLHPRGPRVPYLLYYRRCDTIGPTQPAPVPADKTR
ncbi:hypothetical protein C0J52_05928 [Blattella germanica]|nr:hypothetical protein C0J52_05928 [Blattella germanica]